MYTLRLFVVSFACLSMLACSSPIRYRATDAQAQLQPGDAVLIALKSGKKYRGKVAQVTETELVTERAKYAWTDIQSVTREELDAGKTAATSLGLTALLVVLAGWFAAHVLFDIE